MTLINFPMPKGLHDLKQTLDKTNRGDASRVFKLPQPPQAGQ